MKSSISGRLKKPRMNTGGATERETRSQIQPNQGVVEPQKAEGATESKRAEPTKTWSDEVKGLKIEDELRTVNSDQNGNESETADSVEQFNSDEPNRLKDTRTKGQWKRHQHRDSKVAGTVNHVTT